MRPNGEAMGFDPMCREFDSLHPFQGFSRPVKPVVWLRRVYFGLQKALKEHDGNMRKALYSLGLNDSGGHYKKMKELLEFV